MKIAVFGNFGVHNLGDDLILRGLQQELDEMHAEMTVFCGAPEVVESEQGVRARRFFPAGFRSLLEWLIAPHAREEVRHSRRILRSADRIIIGGGGILVDRHLKALFLWWRQLWEIRRSGTPYHFVANSIELRYGWTRRLFLPFLRGAEKITVRDEQSKRFLKEQGIKALLVPDLAMQAPLPEIQQAPYAKVALALCRWGWNDRSLQQMRLFLAWLKENGLEVVALAFQTESDDDRRFYELLDPSLKVVTDQDDVIQELGSSFLLVGMRLHSVILAQRLKIPYIAIPYQAKVKAFVEDYGTTEYLMEMADLKLKRLQALFQKIVEGVGE